MITIIESTREQSRYGTTKYEGLAEILGEVTENEFLDALDRNNFGGDVRLNPTSTENIYKFVATVYTD